ncbi:MAG: ABC transporter substrate-binding protein [Fibrobacterota bacterium]|nr:MAG: ABC transporter substrate-binding protein [Fibrobacterota bacterium]
MKRQILAIMAAFGVSAQAATTIALNWFAEAEHGGFYAAQAAGLYKAAGLEVKLLPGGPGVPVLQQVATGRVDFGVSNADEVLIARSQGVPVVAVLAPIQTSPRVIMVHQESGIKTLADLKDLTLAIEPQAPFANFLKRKLPLTNVRFVPYTGSVAPFVADKKWAQQAYGISEPFVAQGKGAKPVNLYVSELGYNPYTSVLVVSEKTLKEKPDLVKKMVQASREGWTKYLENAKGADKLMKKANSQLDQAVLDYGHAELLKLCRNTDTEKLGTGAMTTERWTDLAQQLAAMGTFPKGTPDVNKAWTAQFLTK